MRVVHKQIDDLFARISLRVGKTNTTSDVTRSFWRRQLKWPPVLAKDSHFQACKTAPSVTEFPPKKVDYGAEEGINYAFSKKTQNAKFRFSNT